MERGEVLVVDGRECEGAFARLRGSNSGGEVSEFIARGPDVRLDLVYGSLESQCGAVDKECADGQE
jgi:hypothetical protein